jgi:hypothetical protein
MDREDSVTSKHTLSTRKGVREKQRLLEAVKKNNKLTQGWWPRWKNQILELLIILGSLLLVVKNQETGKQELLSEG